MKTRSIQTLLLAATLGLLVTACNNDSDQTVDITKPINVKLSLTTTGTNIPISRAAIGATEFDDDDALGLYIAHKTGANDESPISASLDPKNTKWVNGSFTDDPLYWQNVTDLARKEVASQKQTKKLRKERDEAVRERDELKAKLSAVSSELATYKKAEEQKGLFTREKLKKEAKRISREDELSRELGKAKAFISACGLNADYQQYKYNSTTRRNVLK